MGIVLTVMVNARGCSPCLRIELQNYAQEFWLKWINIAYPPNSVQAPFHDSGSLVSHSSQPCPFSPIYPALLSMAAQTLACPLYFPFAYMHFSCAKCIPQSPVIQTPPS